MEDYYAEFRENLKYYRNLKGWSQSELAIQANSSNGTIGNIESGRANPSFENIIKFASALDIHPADLFLRDSSKVKERETFSKYKHTIHALEKVPESSRQNVENVISDLCSVYSASK